MSSLLILFYYIRFFSYHSASLLLFFFFFNDTATTEIYTLSLHDALPIYYRIWQWRNCSSEWVGTTSRFTASARRFGIGPPSARIFRVRSSRWRSPMRWETKWKPPIGAAICSKSAGGR